MDEIRSVSGPIEWRDAVDSAAWDRALAYLGGHPLQSALWGDARRVVDGIRDRRWMALSGNIPLLMIRIEERRVPVLGWVGWVPRGPAGDVPFVWTDALRKQLRNLRMALLVTDRWQRDHAPANMRKPSTIWIDLRLGRDALWRNLSKKCRAGVLCAARHGVVVSDTAEPDEIDEFIRLCEHVYMRKKLRARIPGALIRNLLRAPPAEEVEARLLVARCSSRVGAGALIIRCGRSAHYFWGATDRDFARDRVGDAVQWKAIEWALSKGCSRYDLEGIDPEANPGTFAFKKKMGGEQVVLTGKEYIPLTHRGRLFAMLDAWR